MRLPFFFWVIFLFTFAGCSSTLAPLAQSGQAAVFNHSYEETWNSAVRVLEAYPIVEASRERGHLKTEWDRASSNSYLSNHHLMKEEDKAKLRAPASLDSEGWGTHKSRVIFKLTKIDDSRTSVEIRKDLSQFNALRGVYEKRASNGEEEAFLLKLIQLDLAKGGKL